eukprot:756585-Hanusia_phi.AAC.2
MRLSGCEGSSVILPLSLAKGKPSQTRFEILGTSRSQHMTLLRALPKTGRTHQIRIHAMHAGLPIVGDNVYGREAQLYPESDEELKESR